MRITVKEAAERLSVSQQFIRIGLQRGTLPIGSAVKMSSRWTYFISEKLLKEFVGDGKEQKLHRITASSRNTDIEP